MSRIVAREYQSSVRTVHTVQHNTKEKHKIKTSWQRKLYAILLFSYMYVLDECFSGHQAVHPPSIKCLTKIAKDLKFDMSVEELKEYQGAFKPIACFPY